MGIGRREFLNLFGTALAGLSASPSGAIAIFDDQYVNRKLGIAFRKPPGWFFATVQEMGEVRAGQLLDLEDGELARDLVDKSQFPILAISKERLSADADRFTPGVTIYLEQIEVPEAISKIGEVRISPMEIALGDVESCRSILKEFSVLSKPEARRVSECDATDYTASFLFEHEGLARSMMVRSRTLVICQNPAVYTVRMYDSPFEDPRMAFEYSTFLESVKMV